MRKTPRILAAHQPARLVFAVLTLTVALAGVVANYSLSYKAIDAFNRVLAFSDTHIVLITAQTRDAQEISKGAVDAQHLHTHLTGIVQAAAPTEAQVIALRRFNTEIRKGDVRRTASVYAVGRGFFDVIGARVPDGPSGPSGVPEWSGAQDQCGLGASLAAALGGGPDAPVWIGAVPCTPAFVAEIEQRPPFGDLAGAAFVPLDETSFDPRAPISVFVMVSAPLAALDADVLSARLGLALQTSYITQWSSARGQGEARRLKGIIATVSNGLGAVILLIGSASIASLMSFSVAERRREIAIRITLGASRRNILAQFLGEALTIGLIALVFGIASGAVLSDYLEQPLNEFLVVGDMTATGFSVVPIIKTVIAFLCVAIASALGPALKAARTDPALILRNS